MRIQNCKPMPPSMEGWKSERWATLNWIFLVDLWRMSRYSVTRCWTPIELLAYNISIIPSPDVFFQSTIDSLDHLQSSPHVLMRTIPISQILLRTTLARSRHQCHPRKFNWRLFCRDSVALRLQRLTQHSSYPLHCASDHLRRESGCSDRHVCSLSPHHRSTRARKGQDSL